jgi:hypothetical protein
LYSIDIALKKICLLPLYPITSVNGQAQETSRNPASCAQVTKTGIMGMKKQFTSLLLILGVLFSATGCQYFYDGRDESLMVVSAAEWAELHQFKKDQRARQIAAARPTPVEGAEAISFTNMSDAYLAGCRSLGVVEVHHNGSYDDAMVLMRNQAVELEASVIVPLDVFQNTTEIGQPGPEMTYIKGRMLRCPDKKTEEEA